MLLLLALFFFAACGLRLWGGLLHGQCAYVDPASGELAYAPSPRACALSCDAQTSYLSTVLGLDGGSGDETLPSSRCTRAWGSSCSPLLLSASVLEGYGFDLSSYNSFSSYNSSSTWGGGTASQPVLTPNIDSVSGNVTSAYIDTQCAFVPPSLLSASATGTFGFDSIQLAMASVWAALTTEGWVSVMNGLISTWGLPALTSIMWAGVVALFLLFLFQLAYAAVWVSLYIVRDQRRADDEALILANAQHVPFVHQHPSVSPSLSAGSDSGRTSSGGGVAQVGPPLSLDWEVVHGRGGLVEMIQRLLGLRVAAKAARAVDSDTTGKQLTALSNPPAVYPWPALHAIMTSRPVTIGLAGCILANMLVLSAAHESMSTSVSDNLDVANVVFTAIFTAELLLWIAADGIKRTLSTSMGALDLFIVVGSLTDVILTYTGAAKPQGLSALRALRAVRTLKLARSWKTFHGTFAALYDSRGDLLAALVLFLLVYFGMATIGLHFFSGVFSQQLADGTIDSLPRFHFETMSDAYVAVLAFNNYGAPGLLTSVWDAAGPASFVYFLILLLLGPFIFGNLLITALVQAVLTHNENDAAKAELEADDVGATSLLLADGRSVTDASGSIYATDPPATAGIDTDDRDGKVDDARNDSVTLATNVGAATASTSDDGSQLQQQQQPWSDPTNTGAWIVTETDAAGTVTSADAATGAAADFCLAATEQPVNANVNLNNPRNKSAGLLSTASSAVAAAIVPILIRPPVRTATLKTVKADGTEQTVLVQVLQSGEVVVEEPNDASRRGDTVSASGNANLLERVRGAIRRLHSHAATRTIVVLAILLSCANLALDEPRVMSCRDLPIDDPSNCVLLWRYLLISDAVVVAIFAAEMCALIFANGLLGDGSNLSSSSPTTPTGVRVAPAPPGGGEPQAASADPTAAATAAAASGGGGYLRDPWNVIDALVTLCSLAGLILEFSADVQHSTALVATLSIRGLRLLRVLRAIHVIPGLRVAASSLLLAARYTIPYLVVNAVAVWMLAIAGVQLFSGSMGACNDAAAGILAPEDCVGTFTLTDDLCTLLPTPQAQADCLVNGGGVEFPRLWESPFPNFDDVGSAAWAVMQLSFYGPWPSVPAYRMWQGVGAPADAGTDDPVSLAFCLLVQFLMAFFLVELFLVGNWEAFYAAQETISGGLLLSEEQKEWVARMRLLATANVQARLLPPQPPSTITTTSTRVLIGGRRGRALHLAWAALRRWLYCLASSWQFETAGTMLVAASTGIIAAHQYEGSLSFEAALERGDGGIAILFAVEAGIKIIAYGPRQYWSRGWFRFELAVVVATFVGTLSEAAGGAQLVVLVRLVRLVRVVRLLQAPIFKSVRMMVTALMLCMPAYLNVLLLLVLMLFVSACVAMAALGHVRSSIDGWTNTPDVGSNFSTFGSSILTLFSILLGNGLPITAGFVTSEPYCDPLAVAGKWSNCGSIAGAPLLFALFFILANCLLLSLLIVVIANEYYEILVKAAENSGGASAGGGDAQADSSAMTFKVTSEVLSSFQSAWAIVDPQGRGIIDRAHLIHLVASLQAPLGILPAGHKPSPPSSSSRRASITGRGLGRGWAHAAAVAHLRVVAVAPATDIPASGYRTAPPSKSNVKANSSRKAAGSKSGGKLDDPGHDDDHADHDDHHQHQHAQYYRFHAVLEALVAHATLESTTAPVQLDSRPLQ